MDVQETRDLTPTLRRFAEGAAAVQRLRAAGDVAGVEEGEALLFQLASTMLLAYSRNQAGLPATVALWLHMQLEAALQGNAARVLHGSVRNLHGLVEVTATSYAAGYIAKGPGGNARGAKARRISEVEESYGVSDRTAFKWKEERPAFDAAMAKLQPGQDPDAFAREYLHMMAGQYRSGRQLRGK